MKQMLQYQKIDMELRKLNRQVNASEEKEVMNKMMAYVKDAQNVSNGLEGKAGKLIDEYLNLKNNYDENIKKVQKLTSTTNYKSDEEFKNAYNQINTLSSELYMIERNLNIFINKAKQLLKDFEVTKNNVIKARGKYKASKENYEKSVSDLEPKINELKAQRKALEKSIDPVLLEKYKSMKNDNIFPVFVPLLDGKTCYGCRMEIASSKLDKLNSVEFITCEHCGRLIYKN